MPKAISAQIISIYNLQPDEEKTQCPRIITKETTDHSKPWAYFDRASQQGRCGGGVVLHLSDSHYFEQKTRLG